jgi:predicted RNase H-like HicB family nuclease
MNINLTAIVQQDGDWWVGWVKEIPGANAQERTREELMESLAEALKDVLSLNAEEAIESATGHYEEVALTAWGGRLWFAMNAERPVILSDGTPGIVRPIVPSDAEALAAAFENLDPDSRIRRFFFNKKQLLNRFGRKCEERDLGTGIVEMIYEIVEPPGGFWLRHRSFVLKVLEARTLESTAP